MKAEARIRKVAADFGISVTEYPPESHDVECGITRRVYLTSRDRYRSVLVKGYADGTWQDDEPDAPRLRSLVAAMRRVLRTLDRAAYDALAGGKVGS